MQGYFSEISYGDAVSKDFIEIAVPSGTDISAWTVTMYDAAGAVRGTYELGEPVTTVAGKDVYVINNSSPSFSNLRTTDGLSLSDNTGTVLQFVSFEGNVINATTGAAAGLTSTDIGSSGNNNTSLETSDQGASYAPQSTTNEGTIACYAPGTLIDTPGGPRSVETLRPGDLVLTLDHGSQVIRWTRSGDQPLGDAHDDAKPVQIKAGALGHNLPAADLVVSPQHRILVGGGEALRKFFTNQAFVPAKALTSLPGIRHMKGKARITWIHFAFERHEVVTANGCLSESLLLGPIVVNGLSAAERQAVTDIFGPAATPDAGLNGPPARECLTVGAVKRQLAKHLSGADTMTQPHEKVRRIA